MRYVQNHNHPGYFPGITRTGTFVSSVHPWHNMRGTGMYAFSKYPGADTGTYAGTTFVFIPTRNFGEFSTKASIPVPGTSKSSAPGTSVSYVRPPVAPYPGHGYALVKIPGCGYGYGYNILRVPSLYPELL